MPSRRAVFCCGLCALVVGGSLGCERGPVPVLRPIALRLEAKTETPSVELGSLTSPELQRAQREGWDTVLVMAASLEQNGPALSLDKHMILGRAVAEGIARRVGHTLVAPLLPYGIAPEHLGFAGTISLSESLYHALAHELTAAFFQAGFRRVVWVSDHGTQVPVLRRLETEEQPTWHAQQKVLRVLQHCYDQADDELEASLLAAGLVRPNTAHSQHAGLLDTAMLMALAPSRVRALQGVVGPVQLSPEEEAKLEDGGVRAVSFNGVLGDPRAATAALGQRALDVLVRACAAELQAER